MDDALVLAPDLAHFLPEPFLRLDHGTIQSAEIIGVLRAGNLAEVSFHERGAVLERALQIGHAAQELSLVDEQLVLPFPAPLHPMRADVLELGGLLLERLDD